jgi:RNA recognition motif-containing protein
VRRFGDKLEKAVGAYNRSAPEPQVLESGARKYFESRGRFPVDWQEPGLAGAPPQGCRMSTRLYVSNLPVSATKETLASRFGKFGSVLSVVLEAEERSKRRGAFVEMNTSSDAQKAIAALNLSDFDGRLVSVYLALGSVQKRPS